ncbi:lipoprotein [Rhizobium sp. TRM95111]|uniref:LPS translocon maturation chaperone LptM n=1 Tax=Rhizobium alarense TaxID=2846851 RepID=UPI001F2830F4|nr:lipoprotein [Rhizobium alarense]MCF3641020.1 lipoprotein [Rhizobium alarense]
MTFSDIGRLVVAIAMTAAVLSGCGRKGDLDAPGAEPVARSGTDTSGDALADVEDRPFILDPLL